MARSGRHNRSYPFSFFEKKVFLVDDRRSGELGALNGLVQLQIRKHAEQTRKAENQRGSSMGRSSELVCSIVRGPIFAC